MAQTYADKVMAALRSMGWSTREAFYIIKHHADVSGCIADGLSPEDCAKEAEKATPFPFTIARYQR